MHENTVSIYVITNSDVYNNNYPHLHVSKVCQSSHFSTLPIVNFHMLSIEEKYSCWNQSDVKVTCVDWHGVHIHNVYISHTRNIMRRLGQLFCQGKITHYKIIHIRLKFANKSYLNYQNGFLNYLTVQNQEGNVDPLVQAPLTTSKGCHVFCTQNRVILIT